MHCCKIVENTSISNNRDKVTTSQEKSNTHYNSDDDEEYCHT